MNKQLNVRALKGAPLSIVIVLMLQKRSVSHALLCQETGYSDRTVTQGLEYLISNQIVTRMGHTGFMLTGDNYQLPLYWDERTEPADPSPTFELSEAPAVEVIPENFSRKNYESENRKIYDLEVQILQLEARISALEAEKVVKNTTESPLINLNQEINTDTDTENSSLIDSQELREICDRYNRSTEHGIDYTDAQLQELIALHPDPAVLEFILPRAGSFEAAKKWCKRDLRHVKYHLLRQFGVTMPALQRITDNPEISPWLIDHHYWDWFNENDKSHTLGWAVRKIENLYDRMNAENSEPLQVAYL